MSRQHATPLLIRDGVAAALTPLTLAAGGGGAGGGVSEADIQKLVQDHPSVLPIAEIDPAFANPVAICREMNTPAGPIDNFLVTPGGLPVIVECKLWRNPEARREVVGQILDYAKELSRWSQADLQREANIRLHTTGNVLLEKVRAVAPEINEIAFNDALTGNLRRGRFLLVIVGDGIREGVEAIADYLQRHAGLHFSLGLVELPFYALPDGSRIVAPRVLARTANLTRNVIHLPEGMAVEEATPEGERGDDVALDPSEPTAGRLQFWKEFLAVLKLDDPEQPVPKPSRLGYLSFMLPAPGGSSWLTVYRDMQRNKVGLFLSASRNSAGEFASDRLADDWDTIGPLLGGSAAITLNEDDRRRIGDERPFVNLNDASQRAEAFRWLAERTNTFVNVLRPRVRSAVEDYRAQHDS